MASTIRIADDVRPDREGPSATGAEHSVYRVRSRGARSTASIVSEDGIYNIRTRQSRRMSVSSVLDEDDDPGLGRPDDMKQKQIFGGRTLLWLSYQSIGVIYGDIGTSPLYVYSSTFTSAPSYENLIGVLSLVLWSMSIMVTLKYVLIILYMDNDGEGGSFSTYSLLSRYLNITHRDPREASMVQFKRYRSGELGTSGRTFRRGIESNKFVKGLLKVVGIVAVTAVMADGVLTPAQSVLGAVQGIEVVSPDISKGTIIGVTDAILVMLFAIQFWGIHRMTFAFSPIVIIWLAFNAAFGIYNLVNYDASVFKAFNPYYAFDYLIRNGHDGWLSLGGVLLSFTGVEALFADLGAFSRGAIQLSWLSYTWPCILLAYIGQAAYISVHPEAYSNPFFLAAPPGTIYPALVIAILAAIVASQAIITATFQLLSQVMKLSYFPQIKIVHTSKTFHGQLFVPLANWLLMIATILVASIYNNTTSLGNAYGVCVMLVTFFDTSMVTLAAMFVWRYSPFVVFFPWLFFACHDSVYLSAALEKVPKGAWFTLTLAFVLAVIFLIWRYGKESQWSVEAEDRFPTSHLLHRNHDGTMRLTEAYQSIPINNIRGLGIFFDKAGETTPTVFSQFVIKLTALPEVMVFFHIRPLERPSVPAEERCSVSRLGIPNCYRVVVRHGYNDSVITEDLAAIIYKQVRAYLVGKQTRHDVRRQRDDFLAQQRAGPVEDEKLAPAVAADGEPSPDRSTPDDDPEAGVHPVTAPRAEDDEDEEDDDDLDEPARDGEKHSPQSMARHVQDEIDRLDEAYKHKISYIVGKEAMKIKPGTNRLRALVLGIFLWMRDNTRGKIADLRLPANDLIEVGFLKEI